jgi:hypothetical protein
MRTNWLGNAVAAAVASALLPDAHDGRTWSMRHWSAGRSCDVGLLCPPIRSPLAVGLGVDLVSVFSHRPADDPVLHLAVLVDVLVDLRRASERGTCRQRTDDPVDVVHGASWGKYAIFVLERCRSVAPLHRRKNMNPTLRFGTLYTAIAAAALAGCSHMHHHSAPMGSPHNITLSGAQEVPRWRRRPPEAEP